MKKNLFKIFLYGVCILALQVNAEPALVESTEEIDWQQADSKQSFTAFVERDIFSTLDKEGRFIFAVQQGRKASFDLKNLTVKWQVVKEGASVASGSASLKKGMASVNLNMDALKPGEYEMIAEFMDGKRMLKTIKSGFMIIEKEKPKQSGKIALVLPKGIPLTKGTYPVSCGVPFPKGALWNKDNVRVVTADGKPVPSQTLIRSRWGRGKKSSIRWLGVDFQASRAEAWWPKKKEVKYFLEYGKNVKQAVANTKIELTKTRDGFNINTGPLNFSINSGQFNLFDKLQLNNSSILGKASSCGLFLKDHKGDVYRAANDKNVKLTVEEKGDLKVIIKAEGWYVKDGTDGSVLNYTLPTDKLCKFVCRIEAYAGKPYVRVLTSSIITYDSYTVRLRDLGVSLSLKKAKKAFWGVEEEKPVSENVSQDGVYLIQDLPHKFNIETGKGKLLFSGKHSAGWVSVETPAGIVTASLREAWQRYPKEFEVKPDELIVHIWPAHGKEHPEINELEHKNIHKILFAHQGKEMNLAMPWKYYLAVAKITDSDSVGVYSEGGQALAGVHSSAMGAAITSDMLFDFSKVEGEKDAQETAECFEKTPGVMADPKWNSASLAAGWIHQYDPENFPVIEKIIQNLMQGYWETGNITDEYGMWLYRRWHHSNYLGDGKWNLYRLNNTTHHYEAFLPWMFYYRSGNPSYLTQGLAHMRNMTDAGMIHYDNPKYPHKELHFHQKRLVGSTKHTNGFNTWGADHAIGGHLTCYNGIMLAYYMTGDRRFLDSVKEWHNTLVNDRLNPNYKPADRSQKEDGSMKNSRNSARDIGNHLGELIDLYQLDYDPKTLALIAPRYDIVVNSVSRNWGLPMNNILLFSGSRNFKRNLLEAVEEYRKSLGAPKNDPHLFWFNHAPYNNFSLAEIVQPGKNYYMNALLVARLNKHLKWSEGFYNMEQGRSPFNTVPDYALYLPTLMYACYGKEKTDMIQSQPFPIGKTFCILKEDSDREIALKFFGESKADLSITVLDPENKKIIAENIPAGTYAPHKIVIPKDNLVGQYVVTLKTKEHLARLKVPISDLPEVYLSKYWSQFVPSRFFVRTPAGVRRKISVKPLKRPGIITDASNGKIIAISKKGENMEAEIGEKGAWVETEARYVSLNEYFALAVSPEKWFAPQKEKLNLR